MTTMPLRAPTPPVSCTPVAVQPDAAGRRAAATGLCRFAAAPAAPAPPGARAASSPRRLRLPPAVPRQRPLVRLRRRVCGGTAASAQHPAEPSEGRGRVHRRRIVAVRHLPLDLARVQVVRGDRRVGRLRRRRHDVVARLVALLQASGRLRCPRATDGCRWCRPRPARLDRRTAAGSGHAARCRSRRDWSPEAADTAADTAPAAAAAARRPAPATATRRRSPGCLRWSHRRIGRMLLRPSVTMTRTLSESSRSVTPTSEGTPGSGPCRFCAVARDAAELRVLGQALLHLRRVRRGAAPRPRAAAHRPGRRPTGLRCR